LSSKYSQFPDALKKDLVIKHLLYLIWCDITETKADDCIIQLLSNFVLYF